ncbi:isochorismatase [Saccharata proteae CBS 121410]|uniref:Isochorismatase n=1 Tax=Saccharata proteae CBS 121410 TaxID=1314787 RepID=A0A9P4HNS9_9PEZI|nr:isochorismatase [Saccharata proteae CBS 121410]
MSSATTFRDLAGIPPATATTKDSVLVIIDAQNEYANGALAVSNLSTSRPAISSLLQRYRSSGGKIIHVLHTVPESTPVFTPGTQLAEEFDELRPVDGEQVIRKKFPGSFAETELEEVVRGSGLSKLVLVGYMAHVCVSTTAREGHQKGFEVLLPEDAIGDRDIPGHSGAQVTQMVMSELGDFFGTVVQSNEIK